MAYSHVLLEVYCGYKHRKDKTVKVPVYCKYGINSPGYHCFDNECPFKSYTQCPNELAYAGEFGEVKNGSSYIGFGGEMEPDDNDELKRKKLLTLWESICKKKIDEAYDEYMLDKAKTLKTFRTGLDTK